jgi:hypothetical protein
VRALLVVNIVISLSAALFGVFAVRRAREAELHGPLRIESAAIALEARIDAMARRIEDRTPPASVAEPDAEAANLSPTAVDAVEALRVRVGLLEGRVAEFLLRPREYNENRALPKGPGALAADAVEIQRLQQLAMDAQRLADERIRALRLLQVLPDRGARNPGVVQSMLLLLDSSEDPEVREGVLRALRGVGDEEFRQALVVRLRTDTSRRVREAAIASGEDFMRTPEFREEVAAAAQSDPSPEVRRAARVALARAEE